MKGGSDDTSKCTVQAKHGRNGKVVFATLSRLGILLPMVKGVNIIYLTLDSDIQVILFLF